ncbi:type II secretion system F family protein [Massilia consociata]|uniref:Type II secretion system F family protein n=1 Tax=Massilia consociata TaxID=760117 RepID=A0ABV6FKQ7_9BURK
MNDTMALLGVLFAGGFVLIWMTLHFGSRWFARRQERTAVSAATELEGMFIFTDSNRIMVINLAVLILLPVLAWFATANLLLVGACMALAFVAPRYVVRYIARRRLREFEQQLPDALLMLTGALRAGASMMIALESVAAEGKPPVSQEFELLLRELRLGTDFGVALQNLERRVPLPDLLMVTSGMALAREVGANLAETLESVARTIRARLQMEGKIRSLTAQGKMQGLVMSALPLFLVMILRVMEPEAMQPLFTEWYGWCTLAFILLAVAVGYHFISKITNIDV